MATTKLGSMTVGTITKLKYDAILTDFIVVQQGKPSSMYDDSCNGTWMLMKDAYDKRVFDTGGVNDYENSTINSLLNSTYINRFDAATKGYIKSVKIPYRPGAGSGRTVNSGANGLEVKLFLLSGKEYGFSESFICDEGTKLEYFLSGAGTEAANKRIAYLDGEPVHQATRSPHVSSGSEYVFGVNDSGGSLRAQAGKTSMGIRFALVLSSDLYVQDDGTLVANTAPTVPSSITVPANIFGGRTAAISWGASTDAQNNLSGYALERSVNGGTWSQIYKGINRTYTDTITFGWNTVQYRVRAYDSYNLYSGYKTSGSKTIINNTAPSISGNDGDLGTKTGAFNQVYTVTDPDSGQAITVTEKIDGVQKRSFTATSGQSYSFNITAEEWVKFFNGSHTMTITATDTYNWNTTRTYTFTKSETEIELTLATPLPTDDVITKAIMSVTRQIPTGAVFTVEVCNNGNDASPTWEDVTQSVTSGSKFFFTNTAKTADAWGYNFRIKVNRNGTTGECFIAAIGGNFE